MSTRLIKKRHFTIPVFLPMEACPFQCIFCDQDRITGKATVPSPGEVTHILHQHLSTIPEKNTDVEAGFFGGTFTGLPPERKSASIHEKWKDTGDPAFHTSGFYLP